MGNTTRNIRYPEWMKKAVNAFAKKNGFENDSKAFIWLLNGQLNRYGYFEEKYTKGIVDLPLTDNTPLPGYSEKEQKLTFEENIEKTVHKNIISASVLAKEAKKIKKKKASGED